VKATFGETGIWLCSWSSPPDFKLTIYGAVKRDYYVAVVLQSEVETMPREVLTTEPPELGRLARSRESLLAEIARIKSRLKGVAPLNLEFTIQGSVASTTSRPMGFKNFRELLSSVFTAI
jgi:hypothetical protein